MYACETAVYEADYRELEDVMVVDAVATAIAHISVSMRGARAMRYEDEESCISAQAVKKCGRDVWFAGTGFSREETGGKEGPYSVR